MVRQFVQPGSQNVPRMALTGKEIVQIVRGSAQETQTTTQAIADLGGGGGLPPGGYLDQPLTNAGTSGTGHWSNTIYARTSAPDSPPDTGANLVLFGEQGGTGSGAGYGASVSAGGGRHDTGDGSYGGDATAQGGNASAYGGGYVKAFGAQGDSGPGGASMGGGYSALASPPNSVNVGGQPLFDLGQNSGVFIATGYNTFRGSDIDLVAASDDAIINGNINLKINQHAGTTQGNLFLFGLPTAVTDLPDDALWIEPGTGALIAAPGTGTGGEGGAAIEPESGPGVKISAITAAAFSMGLDDVLTGLQLNADDDLVNANFTQAQILTGRNGATSGSDGYSVYIRSGNGNNTGNGAGVSAIAGNAGGTSGNGGPAYLGAGAGNTSGYHGGDVYISIGQGLSGADLGMLKIFNMMMSDPIVDDAIWNNNGIPMFSGVANYTGTPDIAGNTLTVVNGIITAATGGGVDVIESDTSIVATSSAVSNIINYSFSASFGAITALTGTAKTMTVTGLLTTDQVYVECISAPPSGYVPPNARVSAPNTLELFFTTSVALGITLGSLNFVLTILR